MPDLYDVSQVVDKTLTAAQDLFVYQYPYDGAPAIAVVKSGDPVGVVYAWLQADPANGRTGIWWQFWPVNNYSKYYYAPQQPGLYNLADLRQQGVLSVTEQIAAEQAKQDEANTPWYTSLFKQILPYALIIGLGGAAIRGFFSSRNNK